MKKTEDEKRRLKLSRFFANENTMDTRTYIQNLLMLNAKVKIDQGILKNMREQVKNRMSLLNVGKIAGKYEDKVYVITLSEGGNPRREFDATGFRRDYPELYKKYTRTSWAFGGTNPQLTIKEYKPPKRPCETCSKKNCEKCTRLGAYEKKVKDMEELLEYSEGGSKKK